MEENELRALIEDGFKRFEEGFRRVDERFNEVDKRFDEVDSRFGQVNQEFATLRAQFADQLDGLSDGFHAETRALKELIIEKAHEARLADEGLDRKIGLLGENLGNIRTQLAQYHHRFEAPLEARVVKLEAHAWATDQKKKDGRAAEPRRRS